MHLHCCHGLCKSDTRRPETGVTFMPFPKPRKHLEIAKRWAYLCATQLTVKSITRNTYICSKHFPVGAVLNIKANPSLEPFNARKQFRERDKGQESARVRHSDRNELGEARETRDNELSPFS